MADVAESGSATGRRHGHVLIVPLFRVGKRGASLSLENLLKEHRFELRIA